MRCAECVIPGHADAQTESVQRRKQRPDDLREAVTSRASLNIFGMISRTPNLALLRLTDVLLEHHTLTEPNGVRRDRIDGEPTRRLHADGSGSTGIRPEN